MTRRAGSLGGDWNVAMSRDGLGDGETLGRSSRPHEAVFQMSTE